MKTKAVLFDMDGVLVEAKEWHYKALNEALIAKGITPISRNEHLSIYDGLPTKDKLKRHPETRALSPQEHTEINYLKQKLTCQVIEATCKPNSSVLEVMEYLRSKDIKIACCSNSIRSSVEMMLGKSGVLQYMDFFISNEDVENSKPAPDMYLEAIQRLGVKATEVLICEDNIIGITAALHSGGYVLEIGTIEDTNQENITKAIAKIESDDLTEGLIRPSIRTAHVNDMINGWFVGDFYPAVLKTKNFEAGMKSYKKGDKEDKHYHKVATEITVIATGKVIMCEKIIGAGEMILMEPGVATSFEALEDTITFVIKTVSVKGDKYTSD
jgi:HAD superfamily hydrolase (TIGR01509 family)